MKRVTVRCAGWLWIGLIATFAAPAHAAGIHFGVEGGLTLSKLQSSSINSVAHLKNLESAAVGAYVGLPLAPFVELQPELIYLDKGVSFGTSDRTDVNGNVLGTFESLYSMPSLELPVLVRVSPPSIAGLRPVVFAGPFAAVKLSESFDANGGGSASVSTRNFKSADFGLQMGAGVEFPAGPGRLTVNGRFDLGLSDVRQSAAFATDAVRSRSLVVMAGYRF